MPKKLDVKSAKELNGATVCVAPGTTTELNLADYFRANKMTFKPVVIEKVDEVRAAFFSGRCDVYTNDSSSLYATRAANLPPPLKPEDFIVLPEIISKEPLAPGGAPWRQPVRRHRALVAIRDARGRGIRHHLQERRRDAEERQPHDQAHPRRHAGHGQGARVDEKWVYNIVKQVGNYGESFERNVGSGSPLKIDRGLNKLWTKGGLQYAPPIRVGAAMRPFVLAAVRSGLARRRWPRAMPPRRQGPRRHQGARRASSAACRPASPGFAVADSQGKWIGLDVDVCRAVSAAIFGESEKVKYVPLTSQQRFTALQSGEVDLLSNNTTVTLSATPRSASISPPITYYDGQGFLVPKKLGAQERQGAEWRHRLRRARHHHRAQPRRLFPRQQDDLQAGGHREGRGNPRRLLLRPLRRLHHRRLSLAATRAANVPPPATPDDFIILPEIISKEPLAPMLRHGDNQFADIVRWTQYAMLEAEEYGITSKNVDEMLKSENPDDQAHPRRHAGHGQGARASTRSGPTTSSSRSGITARASTGNVGPARRSRSTEA